MADVRQTFSDIWYRVADFKPRLSSHLMVRRHTYRNTSWFIIGDPASSKFYRFNTSAYRFLGLLDGKLTVQEAWDVCTAQMGDDAPTQSDCINLLSQLQLFGLLRNDLPIDPSRLRDRIERVREQKYQERTGKYVFYTIPVINPERFLEKYANLARLLFSGWGMFAILMLVLAALWQVIPRGSELVSSFNNVIAPENLIWLSLSFMVIKVIHEFGHGFACKAYGGRVTEIGIFMMLVLPIPYCDATSSWAFPNKWHRILVASGGIMVELIVASIAAFVWVSTSPGFLHTLTYNIMFLASVATVLFNINPLLRYDGYYILADLLEIPNLGTRSHELLKWLTKRYGFGLKGEPAPPLESRVEGMWMTLHAACAFPYRVMILAGIVLFVSRQYFVLGLLIGAFGLLMWLLMPVFKGISFVVSDPSIQLVRPRAVVTTFGTILLVIVLVGFIPMPEHVTAVAVVEPRNYQTVRAPQDGYLRKIISHNGDSISEGDLVVELENPILDKMLTQSVYQEEYERLRLSASIASSPVDYALANPLFEDAKERHSLIAESHEELNICASQDGIFIAPELHIQEGAFIQRGAPLGMIASLSDMVVRASVSDIEYAFLRPLDGQDTLRTLRTEVKVFGLAGDTHTLEFESSSPVGVRRIRYPSLGQLIEGGGVAVDPSDPKGQSTLVPQWEVTLAFADDTPTPNVLPGTRAMVRFTLESRPLISQWYRKLRRALSARYEQ